jgi:formate hydrogenlyase subunit 3/multisubunit Na+/H+ antiporter MnhD subunit
MIPLRIDWQMHPATAPTPISGYISAVLLKSAPFGLLILFYGIGRELLPTVEMHHLMYIGTWVAALTIFFAAFMAVTQSDIKGVLIYSTVSQLGYIILGICLGTPMGIGGGLLHLINHMLFKNLAFLCAGALMYTTHAHSLNELGGIGRRMPLTTLAFGIATMSAAGVPPFNGFTSKWMLYHALIDQNEILLVLLTLSGSVLTLAYFAKFLHSAFMGQLSPNHANVSEASPLMLVPMGLLACLCLITGIVPGILLTPISYIMKGLGIDALTTTISGITSTTGAWNAPLVSCMILVAFAFVAILLKLMNSKVRYTHIHMCGVTELPQELTNVTAEHVYEAPLQLIVRLKALVLAPFTKE